MKKLFLLLAILTVFIKVQAQSIKENQVPSTVTAAFHKAYPTIKDVDWKMHDKNYAAEFDGGKLDVCALYSPSGKLIQTEEEIASATLPPAVMEYVRKTYKEDDVKKAFRITNSEGIASYRVNLKGMDMFFDAKGSYLRTTKERKS